MSTPPLPVTTRLSTWFQWHDYLLTPGVRVLDLACGEGKHSIAAARRGAVVTAVDHDPEKLAAAREAAAQLGLEIAWAEADLEAPWPAFGEFDAILVFNYLDRARIADIIDCLAPGGSLIMETYLAAQRELGWGPSQDAHLLRSGELPGLVDPLEVVHYREVLEPVDAQRWRAVASVVAEKTGKALSRADPATQR